MSVAGAVEDTGSLRLEIDTDNNGTDVLEVFNGAGQKIMELQEDGDLLIRGSLLESQNF